jgi:hypothetical protein
MPTPQQLRIIHAAARHTGLIDAESDATRYRLLLKNVADVETSKALTQAGFEDVMAVMEDMGYRHHHAGETYWRDKVGARGSTCGERMLFKIEQLAARSRYELTALVLRHSGNRTERAAELLPREAWNLIEMLKAAAAREAPAPALF